MRTQRVGGLRLLDRVLLMVLALSCFSAEDGHVFQNIVDCEYSREDLSDMVYLVKLVFNQKLLCDYDSRRGKYVGYDEFGIRNAEKFNNQSYKLAARKAELETVCKANARYYVNTTTREVPPVVTVSFNEKSYYGQLTVLECHMYDFYPKDIAVTWLKDETVVNEGIFQSETMANGDWTYQFHSYLELVLQQGEKVSCQVEHSSFKKPLVVLLDSSSLDNRIYKLAVGITSLILGLIVTVAGAFYYRWRTHRGGGSGIGRAVCQRFASEGASVVVADRNEESAHKTLELLSRNYRGQEHVALEVDVSLKESVGRLVNAIQSHYFQPPSICVSAAGITQDEFLLKMEEEDFDRVIQVNLKGTFLLTQAVSSALVAAGISKGSIITVGSIVGKVGNVGQINYSASKAGVEGLTRTAAKELSKYGIRCNCILPGFIASPMTENLPEKVMSKVSPLILMGRMGKPAEVADVCAFLASDDSQYITGVSIEVAGGLFIG